MPENTNIIFFDEYKKLDKLCSEMYGKNSGGITCYLNDMMAVPVAQRNRIPEWNQTYDRLRELRHIRNQMAHGRVRLRIIHVAKKMSYGFGSSRVRSCIHPTRWRYIEDRQREVRMLPAQKKSRCRRYIKGRQREVSQVIKE